MPEAARERGPWTSPLAAESKLQIGSNRSRLYINFRRQCSMDRAFVGNLQELRSLFVRQRSRKMNVAFDSIEHTFLGFALGAIGGVNLRVSQMDVNFLERPCLAP